MRSFPYDKSSRKGCDVSMVLNSRRPICGINPKLAKKICKMCHDCPRSTQEIARMLSISEITAESWLVSLAEAGYLNVEIESERIFWLCTPKGYTSLVTARFGKPLSGEEFSSLLFSIIQRAEEYNANETFPLCIDKIYAFGSVFTQPWQIEDPNIAISVSERPWASRDSNWRLDYCARRYADQHLSIVEQLYFAEEELGRFLKRRKEYFSIYNQDVSEISDEKRLIFIGDHIDFSSVNGALMTTSEIRDLGEEIARHRSAIPESRRLRRARVRNEDIVNYWRDSAWFLDLNISPERAASCCWRCGSMQDIQRCHIVPDALGGGSAESNLVLLCARCHAEGPNLQDEKIMFDWIKSYRKKWLDDFWINAAMDEYKRIYDKDILTEVEEILCKERISIEFDAAIVELKLLANEAAATATFHFGQTWLNNASLAGCFRMALEELPDQLRRLCV